LFAIAFPAIDPVLIEIGPFAIRWYSLAYIVGILLGWRYLIRLARRSPAGIEAVHIDDIVVWVTLGIILGGRFGYTMFYKPGYFLDHPLEILAMWRGGMSFHGGLVGVLIAILLFARLRKISFVALGDIVVCAAPIGLFFGRLANFVNGELFGRVSDVPWAMVFPYGGPLARHPSQLYEAALEGLVLFAILAWLALRTRSLERPGLLGGTFLAGYGIARIIVELFRQPDAHLGFLAAGATMGQLLSLPLVVIGAWLIARALKPETS
jgi:phosphatidylglycerol:prolipoprotein diacylglycerol transferase